MARRIEMQNRQVAAESCWGEKWRRRARDSGGANRKGHGISIVGFDLDVDRHRIGEVASSTAGELRGQPGP